MKYLERAITFLVPTLNLTATPWIDLWNQRERRRTLLVTRVVLVLASIAYPAHIYLDRMHGLTPARTFLAYRVGLTLFAICVLIATYTSALKKTSAFKAPLLFSGVVFSLMQTLSITWNHSVPFFFSLLIPMAILLVAQMSVLGSLLYFGLLVFSELKIVGHLLERPAETYSLVAVCIVIIFSVRSRQRLDVDGFVQNQIQLETQEKLIQLQKEYNEQIRSFLPKEIYRRFEDQITHNRQPVVVAMDTVLRPTRKNVACLFSDIRGFTQGSKDLNEYGPTVVANIRTCTAVVENNRGIPRLVGDLILAYFDEPEEYENVRYALTSAFGVLNATQVSNGVRNVAVKRFCLLSVGESIVGNIGGYDSSREITVIGNVVNILSRIDPLTKTPELQSSVGEDRVIFTESFYVRVMEYFKGLEVRRIALDSIGLSLRDFPEEKVLFSMSTSTHNSKIINAATERPSPISTKFKRVA